MPTLNEDSSLNNYQIIINNYLQQQGYVIVHEENHITLYDKESYLLMSKSGYSPGNYYLIN